MAQKKTQKCSIDPRRGDTYGPGAFGRARSSAAEHLTFNQRVDGSIPSGLTKCKVICYVPTVRTYWVYFVWSGLVRNSARNRNGCFIGGRQAGGRQKATPPTLNGDEKRASPTTPKLNRANSTRTLWHPPQNYLGTIAKGPLHDLGQPAGIRRARLCTSATGRHSPGGRCQRVERFTGAPGGRLMLLQSGPAGPTN